MKEKIHEIRVVDVKTMPQHTKDIIVEKVIAMNPEQRAQYKGFAEMTFVSTPKGIKVKSIEPIEGTCVDWFKRSMEGIDFDDIFSW